MPSSGWTEQREWAEHSAQGPSTIARGPSTAQCADRTARGPHSARTAQQAPTAQPAGQSSGRRSRSGRPSRWYQWSTDRVEPELNNRAGVDRAGAQEAPQRSERRAQAPAEHEAPTGRRPSRRRWPSTNCRPGADRVAGADLVRAAPQMSVRIHTAHSHRRHDVHTEQHCMRGAWVVCISGVPFASRENPYTSSCRGFRHPSAPVRIR